MAVLCKLADPAGYRAFDWDMLSNPADFDYWLRLFATFPNNIRKHLQDDGLTGGDDFESRWSAFLDEYSVRFDAIRSDPVADGPISTLSLGTTRQEILDKHGWPDPYLGQGMCYYKLKIWNEGYLNRAIDNFLHVLERIQRWGPNQQPS